MMLRSRRLLRFVFPLVFVALATACTQGDREPQLSGVEKIDIPEADTTTRVNFNIDNPTLNIPDTFQVDDGDLLTLVWSDEFNGAQLDPEVWFFETGDGSQYGIPGWGNNELQYYLPDNARLDGGRLIIEAKRETVLDRQFGYTSARINTRDRFAFKYGRIEASIKMPSGQGLWPAFWMLSQDSDYLCGGEPCVWAAIGEIDIVEAVNLDGTPNNGIGGGNEIFGTIHYGGEFPNNLSSSTNYTPSVDVTGGFNTYAIEWDEFEIRWYFNGLLYAMENSWDSDADGKDFPAPFDQNFHILFNLAVGGNFPGSPNGTTPFPAAMEVDWVRVYSGEEPPPPAPPGDHGPGTAGVFTETTTESPITVTSITNSIDFGGNNTVADANSMAIPAFEGDVVLAIDYQDTGSTFGGVLLNFGGVDLTAYDTLNFTIDTSGMAGFGDLTIQIEPPGAGAAGTNVALSSYAPVSTSGNWATYAIPLADFTVTDFSAAANLGLWNARDGVGALTFGTLYVDDVYFSTEGGAADHGPGTAAVFTETTTESTITVSGITNSIDFGGNNTVADANSMAIPAFEGDVVLSIDYQDSGSTFGGVLLNFGGVDLTAYDTLNLTIDTSGMAGFADLTIQIEPPGAGAAGTNVALSSYAPVSTSGNWATYAIPLADFTVTDFSAAANLGFWNARDGGGALVFGTLYVDDVYFSTEGGGPADHGPGTAAVFTETATESTITVTSITNSIDFGGNNTVADPGSMAIPAYEGDVVLSIDYQDSGSTFGGVLLNFGGVDLTAYDTLNLTIDTSGIAGFADLTVQIEPPGAGAAGTNVPLSNYVPVSTSGNWATYAIPLADFTVTDFSAAANLGLWNARDGGGALVFGTLYVDDVYFSTEGGGGGGGGEIAVNGGFETGDFTGWTQFEATPGDQTVNTGMAGDTSSEGTFHLEINNTALNANSLIKQERVGLGTVTPGIAWTVTFDARGSFGVGGVAFAQVFSETAAGNENCDGCGILGGAPLALNADPTVWTSFSFSGTAGPNTESLTLQLEAVTGPGALANVFYDNISIVVGGGGE
jgi:beta-glucanase (GH16 family)